MQTGLFIRQLLCHYLCNIRSLQIRRNMDIRICSHQWDSRIFHKQAPLFPNPFFTPYFIILLEELNFLQE